MMKSTIIALMYDFDKTLCTKDMQEFSFIPSLHMTSEEFWRESEGLARKENMDNMLAYMYTMLRRAGEQEIPVSRAHFVQLGKKIEYYPGVETWFERINQYGREQGVRIEHYVISSGLKEIIEGSSVYRQFKAVYGCEFLYDVNGVAVWPKNAVNYTGKTQFLFRINKGVLDIYERDKLNDYTPEEKRRIPFGNMIYIGDGMTDVPCMKLVKANGGRSVAVFKTHDKDMRAMAAKLMHDQRVDYIAPADYAEGNKLERIVKKIIDKMAVENELKRLHNSQKRNIEKQIQ